MKSKLLVWLIPLLLLASLVGCSKGPTQYVNEEFGYTISYPGDWIFIEPSENVIIIKPDAKTKNQIQVGVYPGEANIVSLPEAQAAEIVEQILKEVFDALGDNILEITSSEPISDKWDWEATFEVYCAGIVLKGEYYLKETPLLTYTLFVLAEGEWPEATSVLESFYFIQ